MKEKQKYILFVLVLILLGRNTFAQSTKKIFGYVYDSSGNVPLVGANVIIEGSGIGTSTNENGYFHFDNLLNGTYSVTVSFIGYKSKTEADIIVNGDQPKEVYFYLTKAENKLDEIVITSKNNSGLSSVKILDSEKIDKSNSQSVAEILKQVSGLEIESTGGIGSAKRISIRGSNTNQVLVLLDGIPLNNQSSANADLSKIPTNIVEKIEIYEGGSSSKFGSGAIGGAINIITKRNFKNEYKLNLSGGTYGYFNVEPGISGNYKNLSFYLSYNSLQSKNNYNYNTLNTTGKQIIEQRINADIKTRNFFSRLNYKYNNYFVSLNAQQFISNRGIPGKTKALTAYARSKNNSVILSTHAKATFDNLIVELNGSYSNNITNNTNMYPDNAPLKYRRYSRYDYQYRSNVEILNTTIYYTPFKWMNIIAGYNGKLLNYSDKNFLPSLNPSTNKAKDISNGLFVHQEYKIKLPEPFNKITFSPSVRYDEMRISSRKLKRFEHQWSPSLSLYLSAGKKYQVFFKSSISRSFRIPTFSDLFYQDVRIEGKPDLLPEKSLNKEIGLGWQFNNFGELKAEATYYNYTIEDMIVWKLGSFEVFRPFNNDAEITGQNYSLNYKFPNKNLSFTAGYTYLQPLDKNNHQTTHNKIIPYRPQHSFKSSIQFGYKNFTSKIDYRFVSKRYVTIANTVSLPSYQVIDLTLLQKIDFDKLKTTLIFSVNNLANEHYEIIRGYPIPGREFRIGIKLNYL